jgi:hypothetical protein
MPGENGLAGVCAPTCAGGRGGDAGDVGASGGLGSLPTGSHRGGSGCGTALFGVNAGVVGENGTTVNAMGIGGKFGGGAGSSGNGYGGTPSTGGGGAVRIIWPGKSRGFPNSAKP